MACSVWTACHAQNKARLFVCAGVFVCAVVCVSPCLYPLYAPKLPSTFLPCTTPDCCVFSPPPNRLQRHHGSRRLMQTDGQRLAVVEILVQRRVCTHTRAHTHAHTHVCMYVCSYMHATATNKQTPPNNTPAQTYTPTTFVLCVCACA